MTIVYTDAQREAIGHREGNLLILACAGSGKTEVISRRIAELVRDGTPRSAIIAFTFMDRAADELKARIRRHLETLCPDDPSLGDMYVGTVHSFCLQLLREINPAYRGFEVMDDVRQAALIVANYYQQGDRGIGLVRLQMRGGIYYTQAIGHFLNTLNVMHVEGITPNDVEDGLLAEVVRRYTDTVRGRPNQFFDFNSIIDELISFLGAHPEHLERTRDRFQFLVVDEYQDIDPRQEELIRLISDSGHRVRVTCVGDDDQAVFGWRGARIDNILTFDERYPDVTRIDLTENFRSTHAIVEMANAAIRVLPADRRLDKQMRSARWQLDTAGEPTLRERMADHGDIHRRSFATEADEAAWVADRIEALRGVVIEERDGSQRAIDYSDMAILLRQRKSGQAFVDALDARGIPSLVKGTGGLFQQPEVRLVYAAICLWAGREFWYTDLGGQRHQLGEEDTREFIRDVIQRLNQDGGMPRGDGVEFLGWMARKRAEFDRQMLPREERGHLSRRIYPQALFHEMLSVLGAGSVDGAFSDSVLYNLGRLSTILTEFEAVHQWVTPRDLTELQLFLGVWMQHRADAGPTEDAGGPNAVQILTVHAAKGLEWPVVFVPEVSSYIFPSSRRNRPPETFLDTGAFNASRYAEGDDGERRLWYVALTRCRKFLHVSAIDRNGKRPTPFFREIQHNYVREDGVDPTERQYGNPTPASEVELFPTTFSDLNYYWGCPTDYRLRRLMGFGPGVREAYGYGQQIHNLLAEVHERAKDGEALDREAIEALVQARFNLRYTRGGPLEALRRSALRSVVRYVEEYEDHARLVLEAEKPFEYIDHASGALISGTIDLLERVELDPEGMEQRIPVCVVDFKTHRWDDAESYRRRLAEVTLQLQLYASAARHALGVDAETAAAHFLAPRPPDQALIDEGVQERVDVDVSPPRQADVLETVAHTVESIRAQDFPRAGPAKGRCPRCDFKMICPGLDEMGEAHGGQEHDLGRASLVELRAVAKDVDMAPEALDEGDD